MNVPVVEAINRQINSELSASYSYLAMSAWCEGQKFTGAARWLRRASDNVGSPLTCNQGIAS